MLISEILTYESMLRYSEISQALNSLFLYEFSEQG